MNWWHNIDQSDAQYYEKTAKSLGCEDQIRIEPRPATIDEIINATHKGVAEKVGAVYEPDPSLWSFFASDEVDKQQFMIKFDEG